MVCRGHVQLDTGCELQAPPERPLWWWNLRGLVTLRTSTTDIDQRAPSGLKCLDLQDPFEMGTTVMIPTSHAKRRWEQTLLDVIPHRASRHIREVGEVLYGKARVVRHCQTNIDS
jgi:hypothetical protein